MLCWARVPVDCWQPAGHDRGHAWQKIVPAPVLPVMKLSGLGDGRRLGGKLDATWAVCEESLVALGAQRQPCWPGRQWALNL